MAQIGRFVSVKNIIWNIYKNTGIQDQINQSDIMEWAIDVLSLIGNPAGFVHKVTGHKEDPNLDIVNYRAKLPCTFHKIRQVAVDGIACLPATNTFQQLRDGDCCGISELGTLDASGVFVDNFGNTFSTILGTNSAAGPLTYELNNDYITLSIKTGKVCMSYLAHAVDCDGFPMIPDEISYIRAVEFYCLSRIDYQRWRANPDSTGLRAVYENSEREYEWYVGQAASKAKSVGPEESEIIKNALLRLKPNINQWQSFYGGLGTPEMRKIK